MVLGICVEFYMLLFVLTLLQSGRGYSEREVLEVGCMILISCIFLVLAAFRLMIK